MVHVWHSRRSRGSATQCFTASRIRFLNTARFLVLLALFGAIARADQTLRIGYQKTGAFLLVKEEGGLEKRLAPLGWNVAWTEFVAGVPLLEALGAGQLDLGHSGDAPVIFAQVSGAPIVYLAASGASPQGVGLLVPNASAVRNVADLKGKRIIVGKGSSAHFFLVRALAEAGLAPSDITPIYLNPADARAAYERGEGDAWAIWDPYLAAAELAGQGRIIRSGENLTSFREFYLADGKFAREHPDVIAAVLSELNAVGKNAKADPRKVAQFLALQLKIAEPILEKSEFRKFRYGALAMSPQIVAEQQAIADAFFQLHLVPTHVRVADLVWQKP